MVHFSLAAAAVAVIFPIFTCAAPAPFPPALDEQTHVLKERAPVKINVRNPYEATKVYRSSVPIEEQEAIAAAKRQVMPIPVSSPSPSPGIYKRSYPSPSPSPMARRTNLNERKVKADPNNRYANVPVFKREPTPTHEREFPEKWNMQPLPIASPGVISVPEHPVDPPFPKRAAEPSARPEASAEPNVYVQADMRRRAQEFSPIGMLD